MATIIEHRTHSEGSSSGSDNVLSPLGYPAYKTSKEVITSPTDCKGT